LKNNIPAIQKVKSVGIRNQFASVIIAFDNDLPNGKDVGMSKGFSRLIAIRE
jgi:hypothetical protein